MIKILKRFFKLKPKKPDAYTLVLKCKDGFHEYQAYDTLEDAELAGARQLSDYVVGHHIKPWFC